MHLESPPSLRKELESAHHEVGEWAAVLKDWERASSGDSVDAVQEFLRVRVRDHFLWEEEVLFPRVLQRAPHLRDTILLLRTQHLEMLKDIAEVLQDSSMLFLTHGKAAGRAELVAKAGPVIERLLDHAHLEDETLLLQVEA